MYTCTSNVVPPTRDCSYLCICLPTPPYCEQLRAMTLPCISFLSPLLCIETSRCLKTSGRGKSELDRAAHLALEVSDVYYSVMVAAPVVMMSQFLGCFSVLEN